MTTSALSTMLCPTGQLRATINLGNPMLAKLHSASHQPVGVSVDMAQALAQQLKAALMLVVVDGAAKAVAALNEGAADVGFFAIDPLRGAEIAFTAPYVLIEGAYVVRQNAPIQTNAEVDQDGIRVAVGKGSAYDLFLTRELKHAHIVREPNVSAVVDAFLTQNLDVAAGIKQQLKERVAQNADLRMLDGRFMVIEQAMGVPKRYGEEVAAYVNAFVTTRKTSGFVAQALARHGIQGASVAS